jgi:hypothetical protein
MVNEVEKRVFKKRNAHRVPIGNVGEARRGTGKLPI